MAGACNRWRCLLAFCSLLFAFCSRTHAELARSSARPRSNASSGASSGSSRTLAGANVLMRSADASMMLSGARERDALCHVARVLVSDEAIQRAILANTELRAMLRAVNAEHFAVRGGPDATTDDADTVQARAH